MHGSIGLVTVQTLPALPRGGSSPKASQTSDNVDRLRAEIGRVREEKRREEERRIKKRKVSEERRSRGARKGRKVETLRLSNNLCEK